ncbi:MAG: PIN domain-containing protein [Verrucomicrobiota bacterium]
MIGLDTSVVVRLLIGEPSELAEVAIGFLDEVFISGDKVVVSDVVVGEVYFALQHHYGVPKAEALLALKEFFASAEVVSSGEAAKILNETENLASAKPGFVDRLIHADYVANYDSMVTFERKAARLPEVKVLKG